MSERCHRCGRVVKPESMVGGYGPVCAIRMGVMRRPKKKDRAVEAVRVVRSDARQLELEFA